MRDNWHYACLQCQMVASVTHKFAFVWGTLLPLRYEYGYLEHLMPILKPKFKQKQLRWKMLLGVYPILDQKGMDCNASGPCDKGEPGGMVPITRLQKTRRC
ncbi:MAG: hypothetical protein CM1200mP18_06410 [Gammaproteobacteria bacterium]|nr:MAG: hypothetical protein CM1200mP18_06410 [Gammaproteobacteria bacterium]